MYTGNHTNVTEKLHEIQNKGRIKGGLLDHIAVPLTIFFMVTDLMTVHLYTESLFDELSAMAMLVAIAIAAMLDVGPLLAGKLKGQLDDLLPRDQQATKWRIRMLLAAAVGAFGIFAGFCIVSTLMNVEAMAKAEDTTLYMVGQFIRMLLPIATSVGSYAVGYFSDHRSQLDELKAQRLDLLDMNADLDSAIHHAQYAMEHYDPDQQDYLFAQAKLKSLCIAAKQARLSARMKLAQELGSVDAADQLLRCTLRRSLQLWHPDKNRNFSEKAACIPTGAQAVPFLRCKTNNPHERKEEHMKLNVLSRMAAVLAAGTLVVGLLAGCSMVPSKGGTVDNAVDTDTVLILTQGDGMPTLTNAEDFLDCVNVTHGGSAGLVVADGSPFVVGPQRFDQVKNNDIQQARADKAARLELVEAVQGAAAKTPETDLVTAVSFAGRMLSAGTASNKVLIIQHSGVNTGASLPMQELDLLNTEPAQLLDQLDAAAMVPRLNGVSVEFYGLGDVAGSQRTLSAQQVQWLQSFWQAFFDRTGAAVTFHADIVSGEALTENGHKVTPLAPAGAPTFIKVSAEQVDFQPDSTTFLDEAAARKALNGLAEQLKGTSAHYIVAGSTARVDNASREGAQALSLARARAVRDVLVVVAGVPADQITCLGLGNEPTSVRSANEAENRCVYVVSSDSVQATEFRSVGQAES